MLFTSQKYYVHHTVAIISASNKVNMLSAKP